MNQQHRDILTAIGRKQPISTAGIAEYLMDHFGYGGGMDFDVFRDQVSKTIGYLKSKGEIVGEDIPQTKGKPLRYWALANPQSDFQSDEMASDVAEVEAVTEKCSATVQENLTVAETHDHEYDNYAKERELKRHTEIAIEAYEDGIKAAQKPPITLSQAMAAVWNESLEPEDIFAFLRGIEFAEKHHGISQ